MGRPAQHPRLDQLQPDELLLLISRIAVDHANAHGAHVNRIMMALPLLLRWTQTGHHLSDDAAAESLRDFCALFYGSMRDPRPPVETVAAGIRRDPEHPLDLLALAAWARLQLARNQSITTCELAALGNVSTSALRTVFAGSISPQAARLWLAQRSQGATVVKAAAE